MYTYAVYVYTYRQLHIIIVCHRTKSKQNAIGLTITENGYLTKIISSHFQKLNMLYIHMYACMYEGLNSSGESLAIGFQGWPEYSEPGDWLELEYNPGVPATAPQQEQQDDRALQDVSLSSSSGSPPPAKKAKYSCSNGCKDFTTMTKNMRLPTLYTLPTVFTEDMAQAIATNNIKGIMKIRLERQAAAYYHGICPWPKPSEYSDMAKTMCDKYHQLKSSKYKEYWGNLKDYFSQRFRNLRRFSEKIEEGTDKIVTKKEHYQCQKFQQ